MFGAFAELLPPDRAMASSHDMRAGDHLLRPAPRPATAASSIWRRWAAAWARGCDADGMEAIHVHVTNTSNLPAEALENEYPLLVDEYALVADSGGAGRHRGGLGIARQIRAMRDGIVFSVRSDGHLLGAPGLAGGEPGGTARLVRNSGTERAEELSSKTASIALAAGETVRIETGGGGGFGAPAERDPAALAADLRGGKVSPIGRARTISRRRRKKPKPLTRFTDFAFAAPVV